MAKSEWPEVLCPGCRVQMGVKKVVPDGPNKLTGKVIYVCEIWQDRNIPAIQNAASPSRFKAKAALSQLPAVESRQ